MTEMERVWMRMKTTATRFARRRALLSVPMSRTIVLKICSQQKAKSPPADALEYLATQLVRLTLEARFPG